MTRVVVAPFRVANQAQVAGHFWAYVQYVDALRRVGCDVWWLEELPAPSDPAADEVAVSTLHARLRPLGLADHLILYRHPDGDGDAGEPRYLTVDAHLAERVLEDSDLLLNFHYELPASMLARFRRTALVDIDPGLLQLWWTNGQLRVHRHDVYFTIGENLGEVPGEEDAVWIHTPPAVSLDLWPFRYDPACSTFTSISSWHSETYVLVDGELFDTNKSLTYLDFQGLPRRTGRRLELATTMSAPEEDDRQLLLRNGWTVRDAREVAGDPGAYQAYIQDSRGEFGCAKPAYVLLGNAWLSDRTVCYLASGKPAVVQYTGPSSYGREGLGLLRFSSVEEAAAAIDEVNADYERHCRAARELAEAHFAATEAAARMLERALGDHPVARHSPAVPAPAGNARGTS